MTRLRLSSAIVLIAGIGFHHAWGKDIRITIPRRSELTPVQRLNREGVDAVRKHEYEKAEALFYKAYLYDAADPFTLNNLGYISELQGKLDRAQKFYKLASEQGSTARIDLSNAKDLEGKPLTFALTGVKDKPMRVNRMNVEAIQLLAQDRNFEALVMLRQALALDPQNPFTLNNLGVAEEATGNLTGALQNYDAAAASHSTESVVVTLDRATRGKPISKVAAESAQLLRKRIHNEADTELEARMLALHGVFAVNQNDWPAAKKDFLQAYSLDPHSAFSLNNLGYVAEKNGDLETAQFYYSKARTADNANARVGLATEGSAEGEDLDTVASESHQKIDSEIDAYRQAARRQTGPIELIRRGDHPAAPTNAPLKSPAPVVPNSEAPAPNSK
ncbi:MAG TPA: tetratricopeptide repeat protein [Acidobacteriaceae bacterium]|nr:tetratricopeptide repeat protein [Acidobacteriaceae bacterium]